MKKIIVLAFSLYSLWSCGQEQQAAVVAPPMEVTTQTVVVEDVYVNKFLPANIEGSDYIAIRPKVTGYVEDRLVEEGARVKKGEVIVKISEDGYLQAYNAAKAQVAVAAANVENAKLDVERTQSLYDNKIVSEFDLKGAKNNLALQQAQLMMAQASEDEARINLDFTEVRSPMDGVIGLVSVSRGDLVSPSDIITTASESSLTYAYFTLSESEVLDIALTKRDGDVAGAFHNPSLRLSNGVMYEKDGKLDLVSGVVDKSTGTVSVRASFENNGQLRGGSNGYVILPVEMDSVVLVAENATLAMQDKMAVYTIGADSVVNMVFVQTLAEPQDGNYIVTGGLSNGDKIIVKDLIKLRPGMKVIPKN